MNFLHTKYAAVGVASFAAADLSGANLTGDGYIYITEPSAVWTPPLNVQNTARFMWYPAKAALRFGDLTTLAAKGNWNPDNIGEYSFAGGQNARAGDSAFAYGLNSFADSSGIAIGNYSQSLYGPSVAVGQDTYAVSGAAALGSGAVASGEESLAIMRGWADYLWAISIGVASYAGDDSDIAIGTGATAQGPIAVAIGGDLTQAIGVSSIAIGNSARAVGGGTIVVGSGEAFANGAITIGSAENAVVGAMALGSQVRSSRQDGSTPSPTVTNAADPVFMVNPAGGYSSPNRLTIYRNNEAHFAGKVRVQPGGDIPMLSTVKPAGVVYP
jgi:hypothetical protein